MRKPIPIVLAVLAVALIGSLKHNYDETAGVVAHNVVHHSKQYPSSVTITVAKK